MFLMTFNLYICFPLCILGKLECVQLHLEGAKEDDQGHWPYCARSPDGQRHGPVRIKPHPPMGSRHLPVRPSSLPFSTPSLATQTNTPHSTHNASAPILRSSTSILTSYGWACPRCSSPQPCVPWKILSNSLLPTSFSPVKTAPTTSRPLSNTCRRMSRPSPTSWGTTWCTCT